MSFPQNANGGLVPRGASRHEARPGAAAHRLLAGALVAPMLLALGACTSPNGSEARVFDAEPRTVSAPAAAVEQTPADLPSPPAPGSVRLAEGVFTDVLELTAAELTPGRNPVVRAELGNEVDAAPILHLEVRALFYDPDGAYLGQATYVEEGHGEDDHTDERHDRDPGHGDEPFDLLPVRLASEAPLPGRAVSATLQVVQFVTE
ncbi:MAG: hypothetical protein ACLGH4_02020 [Actinomycetes bacterium]